MRPPRAATAGRRGSGPRRLGLALAALALVAALALIGVWMPRPASLAPIAVVEFVRLVE